MIKKIFPFNLLLLFLLLSSIQADGQACLDCHSEPTLTIEKKGKVIPLFIKAENFKKSVNGENGCVSCHIDEENLPYDTPL